LKQENVTVRKPEEAARKQPARRVKGEVSSGLSQAQVIAKKAAELQEAAKLKLERAAYKDYSDRLIGTYASINYFLVYSKYFIYVYDKSTRFVKVLKLEVPIIQVEIIENQSLINYGIELEIVTRDIDMQDDQEIERDNLVLYYTAIIDAACVKSSKVQSISNRSKSDNVIDDRPTEDQVSQLYVASANRIECHSCLKMTRDKKKLFTMTEIGDNVIECFRNRESKKVGESKRKNVWTYDGSLDENQMPMSQLILSDDERYMLGCMTTGFKVFYLLTRQSKLLQLPARVRNINIGYKRLTFSAVFSKDNRYQKCVIASFF
jgi:hypothetical protein